MAKKKRNFRLLSKQLGGTKEIYAAVDLGFDKVKLVLVYRNKKSEKWTVEVRQEKTPFGAILPTGEIAPTGRGALIGVLKELAGGVEIPNVAIAVRGKQVRWNRFRIPVVSDEELSESIAMEAQRFVDMPIEDLVIDYRNMGEYPGDSEDEGRKLEVLLAHAPKPIVFDQYNLLEEAGYQVIRVEILPLAISRVFGYGIYSNILAVDFGAENTSIVFLKNYRFAWARQAENFRMNDLNKALSNALGITLNEAESLKKGRGLWMEGNDADQYSDAVQAMTTALMPLVNELKNSWKYCRNQYGVAPEMVLLSGNGSRLRGLEHFLQKQVNKALESEQSFKAENTELTVSTWKLSECIEHHPIILHEDSREITPSLALPLGLALGHIETDMGRRFNMLPEDLREKEMTVEQRRLMYGAVAAGLLAALGIGYLIFWVSTLSTQVQAAEAYSKQLKTVEEKIGDLSQQQKSNSQLMEKIKLNELSLDWSKVMKHISDNTPPEVWIGEIKETRIPEQEKEDKNKEKDPKQKADPMAQVNKFIENLTGSSNVQNKDSYLNLISRYPDKRVVFIRGASTSPVSAGDFAVRLKTFESFEQVHLIGVQEVFLNGEMPVQVFEICCVIGDKKGVNV